MGILDSHLSDGSQEGEPDEDYGRSEKRKKRGGGRKPVYRTCVRCGEQKMGREMAQIPGEDGKLHRSKELCQPCFVAQNAEIRAERKASEREKAIKRELAQRTLAKRRLIQYIKLFNKDYKAGWVHYDVCRRLERFVQRVENGEHPRLMLFMPPRSGKSQISSNDFESWVLGHHPEWELVISSYNADLPEGFSRNIRERLMDPTYQKIFPNTTISRDSRSIQKWNTTKKGQLLAVGRGGGLTGKGYHIGVIDDPLKDAEEADSELIRERLWDWYSSTFYTRQHPGGGILVVLCMVGETPVLMADGSEKRLDQVRPGDEVATYDNGVLTSSVVENWGSSGRDRVFKITMASGGTVRANGRHPFLVSQGGELKWVRTKDLKSTQRIVALKDSGANGKVKRAPGRGVKSPQNAEDTAPATTTKLNGRADTVHRPATRIQDPVLTRSSSTDTASPSRTMKNCLRNRTVAALSAARLRIKRIIRSIGEKFCASTTATVLEKSEGCCATTVTCSSSSETPSRRCNLPLSTFDFTTDEVVSVESDGTAEVFDVQVARTENFIANGLVSHNTRWHDDDLAGRLIQQMKELKKEGVDPKYIDDWEIISYPAIATSDEYVNADGTITSTPLGDRSVLVRREGEALHPDRYDLSYLLKTKATIQPRHWSALYQQNPVPDEGAYFQKSMFRYSKHPPAHEGMTVCIAGDLAIGHKQTNDWTVFAVAGMDYQGQIYILDIVRFRGDTHRIVETALDLCKKYNPALLGFEKGQIEMAIMPQLRRRMHERKQYPTLATGDKALNPNKDKPARARPLQGRMQQGMVYFAEEPWLEDLHHEFLRFPQGTHDDIVDAVAWVVAMLLKEPTPRNPHKTRKDKSWKDRLKGLNGPSKNPMAA